MHWNLMLYRANGRQEALSADEAAWRFGSGLSAWHRTAKHEANVWGQLVARAALPMRVHEAITKTQDMVLRCCPINADFGDEAS